MGRRCCALHTAALGAVLLTAAPAFAEAPPKRVDLYAMLVREREGDMAPGFGAAGFFLFGPLELGANASLETQLIGYSRAQVAADAGLRARFDQAELDAAAVLGAAWMHVSGAFLSDDPGASGGIGFVGGRCGATFLVGTGKDESTRASLGLMLSIEHDLSRYTVTYSYIDSPWFDLEGSPPVERVATVEIGQDRAALLLAVTLGFQ
jgi:hypothetical protein